MFFAHYLTPIGVAYLTVNEEKISSITILDEVEDFQKPQSDLLQIAVRQLDEYFNGKRLAFDFPIHPSGTDFQQQVWEKIREIPLGKTMSYGKLSEQMNNPLAIRAVAAANGKNKCWIVIPCHRVIGASGELTGYAGGLWRKRWLLQHEAKITGFGQTFMDF